MALGKGDGCSPGSGALDVPPALRICKGASTTITRGFTQTAVAGDSERAKPPRKWSGASSPTPRPVVGAGRVDPFETVGAEEVPLGLDHVGRRAAGPHDVEIGEPR